MKRQSRWPILMFIVLLMLVIQACEFSASTANIKSIKMTTAEDGKTTTDSYQPGDTFYCIVDLANAPDDTTTKAVWIATQVEGVEPDTQVGEYELESGSGKLTFSMSPESSWPPGQYRVEVYMNGEKKKTANFEVKP